MKEFIQKLPKVELHCHIEGTLEPELMFEIGRRNQIKIPFESVEKIKEAYEFTNLQSFLDIYYQGTNVLIQVQDFYDMTMSYLQKCQKENVRHVEIFFDPQTHTSRGVDFKTVITGIYNALKDGEKDLGISFRLIMSFLRHLSAKEAMGTLNEALPYKEWITAVGLDSSEKGNPPEKFTAVFEKAIEEGFLTVAHAGEEGPAEYIWQALKLLHAKRIDHGVRCLEDPELVEYLKLHQIPLTVCPLSNVKLAVFPSIEQHNLKKMLDAGLCVTINSDDPAYFGGYISKNYEAVAEALNLTENDLCKLAANSINASFLSDSEKSDLLSCIES